MGNPKGFIEIKRKEGGYRPVSERVHDYGEVEQTLNEKDRQEQASRCMDCGVPFCHWACPVHSIIPEWQDAIYRGRWQEAYEILISTNSFPEFTGRVCPALCEQSCVLAIHDEHVTIRENECSVVEKAFSMGYARPRVPQKRTGLEVAVVGSGPAGLSVADRLNQLGHKVTVFEQDDAIGGLLRYGIPDFKLNKTFIDRRVRLFTEEGIDFKTGVNVGVDITADELLKKFNAVCLACGAALPRDLNVEGRELDGAYFAMDFLKQQNRIIRGDEISKDNIISAKGKKVLVIGGGDTGSDCVGTSIRQKAKSVIQIEILPKPPVKRSPDNPWPYWPQTLRSSSSHEEGCERRWSLATKKLIGDGGRLTGAEVVQVEWKTENSRYIMKEIEGTNEIIEADLLLLAMGFTSPVHEGLLDSLGVKYDERGNVKSSDGATNIDKVFVAGDATIGASLVVHAINSGNSTAQKIASYLK